MKKILVLSYYFFPANSVVSPRIQSWADEFVLHGLFPVIVTRHWTGNEKQWSDFLMDNNTPVKHINNSSHEIYYLPYKAKKDKLHRIISRNKILRKLFFLQNTLKGNYTTEADSRMCFSEFLTVLLEKEKFDVMLVSSPPINIVKLGYELSKKFNIPLVIDFRDIWNNYLANSEFLNLSVKDKIYVKLQKFYAKKWMNQAQFVSTVSEPLLGEIKKLYQGKAKVITNGFEEKKFSKLRNIKPSLEKFECSIIGTIYEAQDVSIFIEGIKQFFKSANIQKVQLNFIGLESVTKVADKIRSEFKGLPVLITNKIERERALEYMMQSHVLFYMGWKGYKGIYSAKIFEYLGAGRNIIIAPGDDDVLDALVISTNTGKIANSSEEFTTYLTNYYNEWKEKGEVNYYGNQTEIKKYSRERQAQIMAENILSVL